MFCLFNKIYLKSEHMYNLNRKCILISDRYGSSNNITKLFFAKSYAELITNSFNGSQQQFFAYLISYPKDERLVIYCSTKDLFLILATYYKSFCPNIDYAAFSIVLKLCVLRLKYYFSLGDVEFTKVSAVASDEFKNLSVEESFINDLWNLASPLNISNPELAPIELLLLQYMLTGLFKQELEIKLNPIVKKSIIHDFVVDVKGPLLSNINIEKEITGLDNILNNPDYRFLKDSDFVPDNYEYVFSNYDLDTLNRISESVRMRMYGYLHIPKFLKEYSLDYIINYDLETRFPSFISSIGEYREKINTYLIAYIYRLKKENRLEDLENLSLVKV